MKRFKRIVGLLLCLAMVLSFVPVTHSHIHVHAADVSTMEKISLSASNLLGACSESYSGTNYIDNGNFTDVAWDFDFPNERRTWDDWFDGDYEDSIGWGISADERGDFLLDLSNGGSGTDISHVLVSKSSTYDSDYQVPSTYRLVLVLTDGTQVTKEFSTGWSASGTTNGATITYELGQIYNVSMLYVWATNAVGGTNICFGEFALYNDPSLTGELGTTTVATPGYEEIELEVGMLRGCSKNNTTAGGDYANATYHFAYGASRLASAVDGNHTNQGTGWGIDSGERGDIYINLGSSTSVSRIVFYRSEEYDSGSGDELASEFQVSLLVDGNWVTFDEFDTGLDTNAAIGDSYAYDFGKTYSATAIYLWPTDCDSSTEVSWPGIELYNEKTVQLPTPRNLQTTEVTDNSITVAANTVSAGGKLQFRLLNSDGTTAVDWKDANESSNNISNNSYTFTGLAGSTTYTIQARYLSTTDGYVTTATPATIEVTTEEAACEHTYDNACDATCNNGCGYVREVGDHQYDNACDASCNVCGATRTPADHVYDLTEDCDVCTVCGATREPSCHVYSNDCDTSCNQCGHIREVGDHQYDNACDSTCNECGEVREVEDHKYTNECTDTACSICGATREAPGHKYTNVCTDTACSVCGTIRTAPGHDYDSCDDTECSVCGETREAGTHTYTNVCTDTECSICGATREAPGHVFNAAPGGNCDECVNCDYVKVISSHVYDDTCADADCNICGYIRVADHVYSNACDPTCNDCGYTREAAHVFDNACDTECNSCGTVRKITHVYSGADGVVGTEDDVCDGDCDLCGLLRDAPHSVTDRCATNQTCSICNTTFAEALHVYTDVCDDICNVCGNQLQNSDRKHQFDDACDTTCSRCGCVREAIHVYDSIYDAECNNCGFTRPVLEEPTGLPSYNNATKLGLSAPVFGYYSNNDTDGAITNYYVAGDGPDKLTDGTYNDSSNRAQSEYYNYVEIKERTKVPVILFTFSEATNVCKMDIYGYKYNYYNMEDFRVQVLTEDGEWSTVATITNAFTDGTLEDNVNEALTITFDKAYETKQLRILVDDITNMYGRGDGTTGNDVFGHEAPIRIKEISIYSTPVVVDQLDNVTLNGEHISQYKIVYSDSEPDYNETAAKYIQSAIYKKTGYTLEILEDDAAENDCEILVGETNRDLSATFDAPANNVMKFNIKADGTKIAMEADYFIIAGAAYYFTQKYIPTASGQAITVPAALQTLDPIVEAPNNYIMLIGDGMGVNQTKLFDVFNVTESRFTSDCDISDNEDIFYGYYFPYEGRSRTLNVIGQITDSAAGGTALSTGYKTTNGTVALDWYGNEIKTLTELALELGLAAGVFSTEGSDGATPASFSVHSSGRYDDEIPNLQVIAEQNGILFVDRYYDGGPDVNCEEMTADEWDAYEAKVKTGLNTLASDPDGFFLMYEEAHIDKYLHKGEIENVFKAVYRFNQAIGIFMEYAMYNPDTIVLITADHETGGIVLGEADSGDVTFNTPNPPDEAAGSSKWNHSDQDVPVFAYGFGMEVFDTEIDTADGYYQNASIGRTYAHFMTNGHADDFGDPWYPILVDGTTPEEYPEDPLTLKNSETLNEINISGKVTGSYSQSVASGSPATITIDLTNNGEPTNIKKMVISASNVSAAPATTIVEAQVEVNGELVWLQIYKDVLYGTLYGEQITDGILDFHTFYNAYQVKITVNSINNTSTNGYGTMTIDSIALHGYDVVTPDLGGVVTTGGDENGVTTIQLMKDGAVAYETTTTGRYYYIMDVAAGDYTLVATKDGHITTEYDITVGNDPVRQDVELKYVASTKKAAISQSVRLIEPWAMRSYIMYSRDASSPAYLTSILGYGAYAVIEHKAGDVAPDSWDDIVYNEKAIKFEKSFTNGDEKISHTNANGMNRRYTVLFDFYDMLYTYRMAENVYWVTYYEDAEGIHFTSVNVQSLSGLIDTIKEQGNAPDDEVAVLDDMKALHQSLIDYRGADADIGNTDYPEPVTLKESGLMDVSFTTGSYQYGRRHQIRLIEPWGFKVTLRVRDSALGKVLDLTSDEVQDVGMIFYHDKVNYYFNSGMGSSDILKLENAVVFSKSLGNLFTEEGDSVIAVYDKGIYTYQLNTELYCLPFVKIDGQYYCQTSAIKWNLRDEMTTFRDDTTREVLEREVFEDMINMYTDVKKYLGL